MTATCRASVVIASRDRPADLQECLQCVRRAVTADDEIIVVDSASTDAGAIARVAADSGARLVRIDLPGSARARNVGIRHTRGRVVAFTDDDARVDPEWLNALLPRFSDAAVAAAVGPVFELGRTPPRSLFSFGDFDVATDAVSFSREGGDWFARLRLGAIGSGANLAVRRSAFERYGLFRESLGRGAPIAGDENYFLLTLVESGETVVHEPAARVFHPAQDAGRVGEIRQSYVAYLLYVLVTRPQTRWRLVKGLVKGSRGQQSPPGSTRIPISLRDVCLALVRAPWLVLAARRIDRVAANAPALRSAMPECHQRAGSASTQEGTTA